MLSSSSMTQPRLPIIHSSHKTHTREAQRGPEDRRKLHARHLTMFTVNVSGADVKPNTSKAMRTIKCMVFPKSSALLLRCFQFKSKSVEQRRQFVFKKNVCFNCVNSKDHQAKSCTSTNNNYCKVTGCGKPDHSLLDQSSLHGPDH